MEKVSRNIFGLIFAVMVTSAAFAQEDLSFLIDQEVELESSAAESAQKLEIEELAAPIVEAATSLRLPEAFYQGVLQRRAEQRLAVAEARRDVRRAELETAQLDIDILSTQIEEAKVLSRVGGSIQSLTSTALQQQEEQSQSGFSPQVTTVEPSEEYEDELDDSSLVLEPQALPPSVPLHTLRLLAWRPDSRRPNALITSAADPNARQLIVRSGKFGNIDIQVSATSVIASYADQRVILNP